MAEQVPFLGRLPFYLQFELFAEPHAPFGQPNQVSTALQSDHRQLHLLGELVAIQIHSEHLVDFITQFGHVGSLLAFVNLTWFLLAKRGFLLTDVLHQHQSVDKF